MSVGPLLVVFRGPNRVDEIMRIVGSRQPVRGFDPFNVGFGEELCLIWHLKDPISEGLFDEAWSGIDFEFDDTVLAIDFALHRAAVALVELLHVGLGDFIVDTNFGEIKFSRKFSSQLLQRGKSLDVRLVDPSICMFPGPDRFDEKVGNRLTEKVGSALFLRIRTM